MVWTKHTKEELETFNKAKILYKKCRKLDKRSGEGVLKFVECKFLMEAYQRYNVEHPELFVTEYIPIDYVYHYFPPDRPSKRQFAQKYGYDMERDQKELDSDYREYLYWLATLECYCIDDIKCHHLLEGNLYFDSEPYDNWEFVVFIQSLSKIFYAIARFFNVDEDILCYTFDTAKYELLNPEFYRKQYVKDVIARSFEETGESILSLSKKVGMGHSTLYKLFNGTENFTLKQFRMILPYLKISEDVSERCLSYVAYLENSEIFWRGFEYHKQQATARKKLRQAEEKPK